MKHVSCQVKDSKSFELDAKTSKVFVLSACSVALPLALKRSKREAEYASILVPG